jgi:hypothetical protein
MATAEDLYDTYLRAASAAAQDERVQLLKQCAVADFEIVSPFPYVVQGTDDVATKLGEVAAAMPDGALRLTRTSPVDAHNDVFRVAYENRNAAGEVVSTGLHVVQMRAGLLARTLVFVPADLPGAGTVSG